MLQAKHLLFLLAWHHHNPIQVNNLFQVVSEQVHIVGFCTISVIVQREWKEGNYFVCYLFEHLVKDRFYV